jgi:tRNA A-37 threonylcarbamoyl transferase component Bud32
LNLNTVKTSLDHSSNRLATTLRELCADQWNERLLDWHVVGRWSRLYSEVQLIELQTTFTTRRLIAKRAVRHKANEVYEQRGNAAEREFAALREASEALRDAPGCSVPQPYAVVAGDELLLIEYVPGAELDRLISSARRLASTVRLRKAETHFERLGVWLRTYQRNTSRTVAPDALEQLLHDCLHRLVGLRDLLPVITTAWIDRVSQRLERVYQQIDRPVMASSCHGDFGPWNVLVTPDRLTLLDFFCQRVDSIWIDPLNVVTYLRSQHASLSFSRHRLRRLLQAFLSGYGRDCDLKQPDCELCWTFQQICRLQDALAGACHDWSDRLRRRRIVRQIVSDLDELGSQSVKTTHGA